jgi:hypothetical protein
MSTTPQSPLLAALARPLDVVDARLRRTEEQRGLLGAAAFAVVLAVIASLLCVWPIWRPFSFGADYAALSNHPLDLHGGSAFQLRILSPLLGYLCGLRGDRFIWFPLAVSWLFLGVTFAAARRRFGLAPWGAFAVVFALATTTPILFLYQFPGYTDVTTYLLVLLAYLWLPSAGAAVFFALALLNHESAAFLFPFLLAALHARAEPWRRKLGPALALLLAFVPALAWRHYVRKMGADTSMDAGTYLRLGTIKSSIATISTHVFVGFWASFRAIWVPVFIAMLDLALKQRRRDLAVIAAALGGACLQLLFAFDTSRLLGLAFPAVVLSIVHLVNEYGDLLACRAGLAAVLSFNFVLPQAVVGQNLIQLGYSPHHKLALLVLEALRRH